MLLIKTSRWAGQRWLDFTASLVCCAFRFPSIFGLSRYARVSCPVFCVCVQTRIELKTDDMDDYGMCVTPCVRVNQLPYGLGSGQGWNVYTSGHPLVTRLHFTQWRTMIIFETKGCSNYICCFTATSLLIEAAMFCKVQKICCRSADDSETVPVQTT